MIPLLSKYFFLIVEIGESRKEQNNPCGCWSMLRKVVLELKIILSHEVKEFRLSEMILNIQFTRKDKTSFGIRQ